MDPCVSVFVRSHRIGDRAGRLTQDQEVRGKDEALLLPDCQLMPYTERVVLYLELSMTAANKSEEPFFREQPRAVKTLKWKKDQIWTLQFDDTLAEWAAVCRRLAY